jgi:hypothetical protein
MDLNFKNEDKKLYLMHYFTRSIGVGQNTQVANHASPTVKA